METCLITFIVPVYKIDYDQLRRCVDSILNQDKTNAEYEILLVDDGSPDECPQICDEYAEKYENVKTLHQKNQGLSVVRNNGVNAACGEWVAFVDGDDWIEKDFVLNAVESLKKVPVDSDILIWDGFSETKKGTETIKFMDSTDEELHVYTGKSKETLIDRIIPRRVNPEDIKRCSNIGITWGRIYRRDFLLDNDIENIPGLSVMQDSIFNLWAFEYARTICYQFIPIYHYSMYDESISKKQDPNIAKTMLKLYGYFEEYVRTFYPDDEDYWQRLYIKTIRLLVKCLAKDYANPSNKDSMRNRCKKLKTDLSANEFQTAIKKCDPKGQEFKFRTILFMFRHKMYFLSIMTSDLFGKMRRFKNGVS